MPDFPQLTIAPKCSHCGTELANGTLSCPRCHTLVNATKLRELAQEAEAAHAKGDISTEVSLWRSALELLPPESRQHEAISKKIGDLTSGVDPSAKSAAGHKGSNTAKALAGAGTMALILWKFKFVVVFILTKAKLLLLGLTKASTFFSMLLSFGVYWTAWGWKFAAGLLVCMYVHEMGHVAALKRLGISATAPMFIPGLGAMVRMNQYPATPREDARVGLAGPMWGLWASLFVYLVFYFTGWKSWAAIAHSSAWLNLFNLLPVWQLDGSRGFHSLTRAHRWIVAATMAILWIATKEGLLVLLALVAAGRAFGQSPKEEDRTGLFQFLFLLTALALLSFLARVHP